MELQARPYNPESDEEAVVGFHLSLLREHVRLWSEITGEPYDPVRWDAIWEEQNTGAAWARELAERAGDERCRLIVFTVPDSDKPVGFLYLEIRKDPHTYQRTGVINEIYLLPEYRGKGFSRQMLALGESWFSEQQIPRRQVFVTANNLAAVKLYVSFGYRVTDYRMLKEERKTGPQQLL